jgi:hypothetical protein
MARSECDLHGVHMTRRVEVGPQGERPRVGLQDITRTEQPVDLLALDEPSRAQNGQTGNRYAIAWTIVCKNLCFYIYYSLQLCNISGINALSRTQHGLRGSGCDVRQGAHAPPIYMARRVCARDVHNVQRVHRLTSAMCKLCATCSVWRPEGRVEGWSESVY